ncbi:hypothetical protein [Hymenobacter sp. GOD-10R]|uniref:hypothetical protein n=1 Tax=Hymenobacter sp. GOD-10R TaxID=3093922 RepID=UPI002D78EB76|nr:hypothetical protein [Hymenobacter sp. GOD-10R]WRQ27087.1 hypothetical protein SD425_18600 [Hymenobacter sp. GOD-10R]
MAHKTKTNKDGAHEQYIKIGIPQAVFDLLHERREDEGNTTMQEFLAPVLKAVAKGEISRPYTWQLKQSAT